MTDRLRKFPFLKKTALTSYKIAFPSLFSLGRGTHEMLKVVLSTGVSERGSGPPLGAKK